MAKYRVQRSKQYKAWYKSLTEKERGIVDTRIDTYEFKWNSGLRVYYSFIEDINGQLMLLLLGGNKNSQQSDITEAKRIVLKAVERIAIHRRRK